MKVLPPIAMTDALLVASSIPETDYPVWSAGTNYALDELVIMTSTHRIYKSVAAANLGNTPSSSPTWWVDVGPTNRWAMFDGIVGTQSVSDGSGILAITVAPGRMSALALLDLDANSVRVQMVDGATTVYDNTVSLVDGTPPVDWWGYFFSPISNKTDMVLTNLPIVGTAQITITLTKSGGAPARCGMVVMGTALDIGSTQWSPKAGITDYSVKSTDGFGNTTVTKRGYAKRQTTQLWVDKLQADFVFSLLASLRSTPVVWVGVEGRAAFITYGFYKDYEEDLASAVHVIYSLSIEGLL